MDSGSSRRRTWIGLGVLFGVMIAGVGGLALLVSGAGGDGSAPDADSAASAYLDAWQRQDWAKLRSMVEHPSGEVVTAYRAQWQDLGIRSARLRVSGVTPETRGATATFHADLRLESVRRLEYEGRLSLVHRGDAWRVAWTPAAVHPNLVAGSHFEVERVFGPRAPILAADSTPLTVDAPVVIVGIEPRRVKDRATVARALQRTLGVDPHLVDARLDTPGVQPDQLVPITIVSEERYTVVKPTLYPVPGLVFRTTTARAAATPELAAHVVGQVGPITAEQLHELGAPYRAGDVVGASGLERTFERRLAGTPSRKVEIVDAAGTLVSVLAALPGQQPEPVRTTLDLPTQRAAEEALAKTPQPAALVALRPSTGQILAIVSTPTAVAFDRALDGSYPPGSTFKIVTTAALLASGVTPTTPATCPPTITVNGRTFHNFEGETQPTLTFARSFAISCNTAFIDLASRLGDRDLARAATSLGFGTKPHLGLAATGATFPPSRDATEHAAAAVGQGRVTASPLAMAAVAAAVGAGAWHEPQLVLDPAPSPAPAMHPLDAAVIDPLRTLMVSVVKQGTGTGAAVSGQVVAGKTGTAEFGSAAPPATHAWFVGYRGDLAFAVLVEGGGVGGRVAAPIAGQLLRRAP